LKEQSQAGFRRIGTTPFLAYALHDDQHPSRTLPMDEDVVSNSFEIKIYRIFNGFGSAGSRSKYFLGLRVRHIYNRENELELISAVA
jgi:hypothetical protein